MGDRSTDPCHELTDIPCSQCHRTPVFGERRCSAICIGVTNGRCRRVVTNKSGMCWQHREKKNQHVMVWQHDDQKNQENDRIEGYHNLPPTLGPLEMVEALRYRLRVTENHDIECIMFSLNVIVSNGDFFGKGNVEKQAQNLTPAFIETVKWCLLMGRHVIIVTVNNGFREVSSGFVRDVLNIGFGDFGIQEQIDIVSLENDDPFPHVSESIKKSAGQFFDGLRRSAKLPTMPNSAILYIDNQEKVLNLMMKQRFKVLMITGDKGYGSVNPEYDFKFLDPYEASGESKGNFRSGLYKRRQDVLQQTQEVDRLQKKLNNERADAKQIETELQTYQIQYKDSRRWTQPLVERKQKLDQLTGTLSTKEGNVRYLTNRLEMANEDLMNMKEDDDENDEGDKGDEGDDGDEGDEGDRR